MNDSKNASKDALLKTVIKNDHKSFKDLMSKEINLSTLVEIRKKTEDWIKVRKSLRFYVELYFTKLHQDSLVFNIKGMIKQSSMSMICIGLSDERIIEFIDNVIEDIRYGRGTVHSLLKINIKKDIISKLRLFTMNIQQNRAGYLVIREIWNFYIEEFPDYEELSDKETIDTIFEAMKSRPVERMRY